jgi:hypothetical protein
MYPYTCQLHGRTSMTSWHAGAVWICAVYGHNVHNIAAPLSLLIHIMLQSSVTTCHHHGVICCDNSMPRLISQSQRYQSGSCGMPESTCMLALQAHLDCTAGNMHLCCRHSLVSRHDAFCSHMAADWVQLLRACVPRTPLLSSI